MHAEFWDTADEDLDQEWEAESFPESWLHEESDASESDSASTADTEPAAPMVLSDIQGPSGHLLPRHRAARFGLRGRATVEDSSLVDSLFLRDYGTGSPRPWKCHGMPVQPEAEEALLEEEEESVRVLRE